MEGPDDTMPAATVLVVDDEVRLLKVVAVMLREAGYRVFAAAGALEAIGLFLRFKVDLLITDVQMPEMDGDELAVVLRGLSPDLRVVYMTGYSERRLCDGAVLEKPFRMADLQRTLAEALPAGALPPDNAQQK
jgi:two-component system cell cycle sensor histidine kinase/response regulator CckA